MIENVFTTMPMFTCGICLLFVGLKWQKERSTALGWLMAFLFAATLLYSGHLVYFSHAVEMMPVSDTVYATCNLAVYPLYLIYLLSLTEKLNHPRIPSLLTKPIVLLAPAVVIGIIVAVIYILMTPQQTLAFIDDYLYHNNTEHLLGFARIQANVHNLAKGLFAAEIIPVLLIGWFIFKNNRDNSVLSTHLKAAHRLMLCFIIIGMFSFVANAFGRHHFDHNPWMLALPSTIFSVLLFGIAYIGFTLSNRPLIVTISDNDDDSINYDNVIDNPPANFTLPPSQDKKLAKKIVKTLHDEKLYLRPDFKLADLAERLNTNRKYINQAINGTLHVSFNDLINRMRIEHAVELLIADPEHPINLIAEASGYQSLATFYRNFRGILGCTPKEYLIRLAENNNEAKEESPESENVDDPELSVNDENTDNPESLSE